MNEVASVISCRSPKFAMPNSLLRGVGQIGQFAATIDAHRFAGLNPHVLRAMQEERYRNPQKMITELGVKPKPIRKAIQEAHQWFSEHGYC